MDRPTMDYKRQASAYLKNLFPTISCRAIGLVLKHHEHSFTNAFLCMLEVEKQGREKHAMTIRNKRLLLEIELFDNVIKEKDEEVPVVETKTKKTEQPGLCARLFCCLSG